MFKLDELQAYLKSRGIGCAVYYPLPLHLQECFKDLGYQEGNCPNAEMVAKETLAIPIYPGITKEMQEYVAGTISEFLKDVLICQRNPGKT